MTIKDKLAHYEPKPLGEKGRWQQSLREKEF